MPENQPVKQVSRRVFARDGLFAAAGGAVGAAAAGIGITSTSKDSSGSPSSPPVPSGAPGSAAIERAAATTGFAVPRDWGRHWRAALDRARGGGDTAVCAVVGDSVGFGYWSSDLLTTSWAGLIRSRLGDLVGDGGSGFSGQVHSRPVIYNADSGVSSHYSSRPGNVWAQSGDWSSSPHLQGPGAGTVTSTAVGATLSSTIQGTTLGVWYLDGGGQFSVDVDGRQVGTVSPGSSLIPTLRRIDLPGSTKGTTHTWTITVTKLSDVGEGPYLCGVDGRAKSGVRVDNFSFPGLYSGIWANADRWHSGTYVGGWQNPADLVIYELGGNDIIGQDPAHPTGTPPAVWAQQVQTYLEGVLNLTYGGDAVGATDLIFLWPMFNLAADRFTLASAYKTYALGIAQAYGAALLDISAIYHGSWNGWRHDGFAGNQTDPTSSGADGFHPSDGGSNFIAEEIMRLAGG